MRLTGETEARGEKTSASSTFCDTHIHHGVPKDRLFSSAGLKYATPAVFIGSNKCTILIQHLSNTANTLTGVGHNQQNTQQNSTQDRQEYAAA
jgi:hypothetical protein